MTHDTRDYKLLFLGDTPMFDVRAPVEFNKGAFPSAINLPLMDDVERQKVGTCYKHHGQQAAIDLGQKLVCGELKEKRIAEWKHFAEQNPEGYLYCFRGGLRSRTSQQWLKEEAGIDFPLVQGGYKAMRTFLIETVEQTVEKSELYIIGGMTGTGKTDVLLQLENGLDLEGHAHHRGSSFGKHATPQPSQINFENNLAIDMLKKNETGIKKYILEDEGRAVGSCSVPLSLYQKMSISPIIWLEDSLENRVERILRDYVICLLDEFTKINGEQEGFDLFSGRLRESLMKITKRLGGKCYQRIAALMDSALISHELNEGVDAHREWVALLLSDYYDPMYNYQSKKKQDRIVFKGNHQAVTSFLKEKTRV